MAGGHQNGRGRVFPIIPARQEPQRYKNEILVVEGQVIPQISWGVEYKSTTFLEVNTYLKYFNVDKPLGIFYFLSAL